ncbi:MAG: 4-hydroxythreonine-4-phosphate dehydrogenase, partial [Rhodobacteraceae bacterium]|nr:4-hydroxythreonine-4-phosphate dehydrogenase [Paracoccaceae bacterium]
MTRALVLSCGDPAGIGPELAAKAWDQLRAEVPFAWIGDPAHLPTGAAWTEIRTPAEALSVSANALPVLAHPFPAPARPGQPDPANAASVVAVLDRAVDLVMSGAASGLCTAPINKKVLIDGADFAHPGHTEYLAARAGVDRVVMMLAGPDLRGVPTTIHIALSDVPTALTPALLRETIEITARDLRDRFGLVAPRIAVAGLNPHAGEGGAMGHEGTEDPGQDV